MNKNASQWLLGFLLVAFPLATLILVVALMSTPLQNLFMDEDELNSSTLLPDFAAIEQTPERKAQFLDMLRPLIAEKMQNY
jgi:Bax protein